MMKRWSGSIKLGIWEKLLKRKRKSISECKLGKEPRKGRRNYSHSDTVCNFPSLNPHREGKKGKGERNLEEKRDLEVQGQLGGCISSAQPSLNSKTLRNTGLEPFESCLQLAAAKIKTPAVPIHNSPRLAGASQPCKRGDKRKVSA